jgi:endonuclease YncB( thermonuclease family)
MWRYGRQLAILYKYGNNINKGLVKECYAKHYEGGKKNNGSI